MLRIKTRTDISLERLSKTRQNISIIIVCIASMWDNLKHEHGYKGNKV